jgi:hypothetical protein
MLKRLLLAAALLSMTTMTMSAADHVFELRTYHTLP